MWDIVTSSEPRLQCNLHNMGMISRPKKNLKVCSDADGDQTQRSETRIRKEMETAMMKLMEQSGGGE